LPKRLSQGSKGASGKAQDRLIRDKPFANRLFPAAGAVARGGVKPGHFWAEPFRTLRLTPRLPAGWAEQRKLLGFR
jgi:hypothetical protein